MSVAREPDPPSKYSGYGEKYRTVPDTPVTNDREARSNHAADLGVIRR